MSGLDPSIVQHRLPLLPHARLVKQKLRQLHPRWSLQVKEEIQKQLSVGFLSVVEYPEWLANVILVPKKDGKILMVPEDMEKTSFITEWGTYCYRDVEVYVDDMIVKSRDRSDHLAALESERGIKVDPDKIRAILDMPTRGHRERSEASWTDFSTLCQRAFERIREYFLSPPVLAPPTPSRPLLLYLSVSDVALGCMLAQLDDSGKDRAIYYLSKRMLGYETRPALVGHLMRWLVLLTEFDIHYVPQKSIKGSIVADHLASLPVSDARAIDDDFPDEDVAAVTSLSGWRMYFDGTANHSGYGIDVLLISPHGDHIPKSVRLAFSDRHPATNNIVEFEIYHLPRAQNQFADALATLASMIDIPVDAIVRPLLIESRSAPAYYCLIDDVEPDDGLPWYHDIYHFLRLGVYPEAAMAKDKKALRQLATRFVICGETLYRRSPDWMLLLCLDRASADRMMRECPECQIHEDLIHVPPSELHALTSPWPFFVWGIDIIGKISLKSSSGHEFILVAIDYFTKWVEAASYARLTSYGVASFIRSHIICRYGVPHELISDRGVHFRAKVDTLVKRYSIRHHRSSHFALWAYRTSFRTSTGATPYSLVYDMEAVLPVEIEMGSLRVALKQQIPEADWAQARFDQLNLLDERRLRATNHVHAYQRKMARAFKKRVRPRLLRIGDLVLKVIRGLIRDPRRKFRRNWGGPYFIRELTLEGAAWLMDLDGNRFSEPTNVDQLKRHPQVHGSWGSLYMLHFIYEIMSFDHWVLEPNFLSFLSPYHLGLRYVPCLKTTLRPWDQMSSSTASTWTGLIQLCLDYQDQPPRSIQLVLHFSTLGCHHVSPSGRIDDFMPPDLRPIIHLMPYWAYFCFDEIYGSSWSCMLIPTYEIHIDMMFPPWSLSGVTQLGLHFTTPQCHHAFLPGDAPLIYGSNSVVHVDDLDRAFDDG
ncbi:hypothetical protein CK203_092145 [Vitis vinifera]|uniref:Integrase catalytic domain-containing protein n=1 Tax=Vitis vinifera TaxID=29760 RepID=A0A438DG24_VITVI|nr:hypothetical protein CK203_092145 [Vitis vinifera]